MKNKSYGSTHCPYCGKTRGSVLRYGFRYHVRCILVLSLDPNWKDSDANRNDEADKK